MTESDIERDFAKHCALRGCLCLKLQVDGQRGFPDRTVILPDGAVVFVELKTESGYASVHQEQWLLDLLHHGQHAAICYGLDDAKEYIDGFFST